MLSLSKSQEIATQVLAHHLQGYEQRLVQLLLILPSLTACCPKELAYELFAPIIGNGSLDKVIASIN